MANRMYEYCNKFLLLIRHLKEHRLFSHYTNTNVIFISICNKLMQSSLIKYIYGYKTKKRNNITNKYKGQLYRIEIDIYVCSFKFK